MKEIPNTITTLIAGVAVTLISVWYGQNHGLLPPDASREAPLIDGLFNTMMSICTGLFLLIQGALVVSLFRFHRRKDDNTDAAPVHGNIPLEIVWTAIPAVTVLWLAIYSFDVYKSVDSGGFEHVHNATNTSAQVMPAPQATSGVAYAATLPASTSGTEDQSSSAQQPAQTKPDTPEVIQPSDQQAPTRQVVADTGELNIDVTGLRYAWIFKYPGSDITVGELHVPLGRQVRLKLAAQDVIHAFWVPAFRLKQDTIPGQETQLRFTPRTVGEYPVICAELCGPYHGAMNTRVIVQSPEDYQGWLQSQTASAGGTNQTVATNPAEQSPTEFLTPYAEELGLEPELIAGLAQHPSSHHH